MERST